jgi:hypothetical protein
VLLSHQRLVVAPTADVRDRSAGVGTRLDSDQRGRGQARAVPETRPHHWGAAAPTQVRGTGKVARLVRSSRDRRETRPAVESVPRCCMTPADDIRVGMYTDIMLPRLDGIGVSLEAVGRALRRLGVSVELVTPAVRGAYEGILPRRTIASLRPWMRDYSVG